MTTFIPLINQEPFMVAPVDTDDEFDSVGTRRTTPRSKSPFPISPSHSRAPSSGRVPQHVINAGNKGIATSAQHSMSYTTSPQRDESLADPSTSSSSNLASLASKSKAHRSYVSSMSSPTRQTPTATRLGIPTNNTVNQDDGYHECITCDKLTDTVCTTCAKPVCDKCGYDPDGSLAQNPPSVLMSSMFQMTPFRKSKSNVGNSTKLGGRHGYDRMSDGSGSRNKYHQVWSGNSINAKSNAAQKPTNDDDLDSPGLDVSPTQRSEPIQDHTSIRVAYSAASMADSDTYNRSSIAKAEFWLLVCPECRQMKEKRAAQRRHTIIKRAAIVTVASITFVAGVVGLVGVAGR